MDRMIAYCGLICADCPAYTATQAEDREALEQVAARWREEFNEPRITADAVICDGCLDGGRLSGYCSMCEVRACGVERGVINCAHCDDYPVNGNGCKKLADWFEQVSDSRVVLDEIRQSL